MVLVCKCLEASLQANNIWTRLPFSFKMNILCITDILLTMNVIEKKENNKLYNVNLVDSLQVWTVHQYRLWTTWISFRASSKHAGKYLDHEQQQHYSSLFKAIFTSWAGLDYTTAQSYTNKCSLVLPKTEICWERHLKLAIDAGTANNFSA